MVIKIKMCIYCFFYFCLFANGQPKIEFDAQEIDYGYAQRLSNPKREIGFTNVGDEILIIKHVKTSCGCMVASGDKEPIPPGGSGKIKVRYDMKRLGIINKTVSVFSNSHNEPKIVLRVRGLVTNLPPAPEIEFTKTVFDFDTVAQGTTVRDINFEFKNVGTDTLRIINVKSSSGSVVPIWPKKSILPTEKGMISAMFMTNGRYGKQSKRLTVRTNDSTNLVGLLSIKGFIKKKNPESEQHLPIKKKPNFLFDSKSTSGNSPNKNN